MLYDYNKLERHAVLCIDMKSFYSSVEAVDHGLDPLHDLIAVVGDSVVLAASPASKKTYNIRTGNRRFQIPKRHDIHIFTSRMRRYQILKILYRYAPFEAIHVYSIDEVFLCLDGSSLLKEGIWKAASHIQHTILSETGLTATIRIDPNKLLSKVEQISIPRKKELMNAYMNIFLHYSSRCL